MQEAVEVLLITGPAGIGKSTLCWEIGAQLAAARVPHAIIETDELDRVFPRPTPEQLAVLRPGTSDVSALNLAAMWETYRALGFVDDDPGKYGKSIHGLPVLGSREDISRLVNELRIEQIVITIPSARGRDIRTLLAACERTGAELKIVPGLAEIVDGRVQISDIRNVRVEDESTW